MPKMQLIRPGDKLTRVQSTTSVGHTEFVNTNAMSFSIRIPSKVIKQRTMAVLYVTSTKTSPQFYKSRQPVAESSQVVEPFKTQRSPIQMLLWAMRPFTELTQLRIPQILAFLLHKITKHSTSKIQKQRSLQAKTWFSRQRYMTKSNAYIAMKMMHLLLWCWL